jgi:hypothetical protein
VSVCVYVVFGLHNRYERGQERQVWKRAVDFRSQFANITAPPRVVIKTKRPPVFKATSDRHVARPFFVLSLSLRDLSFLLTLHDSVHVCTTLPSVLRLNQYCHDCLV